MGARLDAVRSRGEVRRDAYTCGRGKNERFAPSEPGALGRIGHESPFLDRCRTWNVSRGHSRGPTATIGMSNLPPRQLALRIHGIDRSAVNQLGARTLRPMSVRRTVAWSVAIAVSLFSLWF